LEIVLFWPVFLVKPAPTGLMTLARGGGGFFSLWVSFQAIGEPAPTGLMTFARGGGGFFSLWVSFQAIGEPAPYRFNDFRAGWRRVF